MCGLDIFGGGGKSSSPVVYQTPKQVSYSDAASAGADVRKRAAAGGLADTIKTSPQGVVTDLTGFKKALTGQ